MNLRSTGLPGVLIFEPQVFEDDRGFFLEVFNAGHMAEAGIETTFVQDNHSGSRQGVLRGLHYQLRRPQAKLVRVVVGEIFDVAVDLRRRSPTVGGWVGTRLSAANRLQQWVPAGFAHGFYVLSEWAEVTYKVSDYYEPGDEQTLRWDDPTVGIAWPLVDDRPPILAPKDGRGKPLAQAELFDDPHQD